MTGAVPGPVLPGAGLAGRAPGACGNFAPGTDAGGFAPGDTLAVPLTANRRIGIGHAVLHSWGKKKADVPPPAPPARQPGQAHHEPEAERRDVRERGRSALLAAVAENAQGHAPPMYFLDSDRLAECTGANYSDCVARRFGTKAIEFVQQAF